MPGTVSKLSAAIQHSALRGTASLRHATSPSRTDAVVSKAAEGLVKWCGWHGMQGVRGSNPLSSTTTAPQVSVTARPSPRHGLSRRRPPGAARTTSAVPMAFVPTVFSSQAAPSTKPSPSARRRTDEQPSRHSTRPTASTTTMMWTSSATETSPSRSWQHVGQPGLPAPLLELVEMGRGVGARVWVDARAADPGPRVARAAALGRTGSGPPANVVWSTSASTRPAPAVHVAALLLTSPSV